MVLDSGTWDDEVAKWAPGVDITQVSYHSLIKREKTDKGGTRLLPEPRDEFMRSWGTVVADESHYLKGRKTLWTKAFPALRTDRLTQLTGTPIPNWAWEAFTTLQLIFPEEAKAGRRLGSYWRWASEWFQVGPLTNPRTGEVYSPRAVGDFRSDRSWDEFRAVNWQDRMLRRLREECLDLPPLTWAGAQREHDEHARWRVPMVPAQKKAYRALKKDFVTWLESGVEVTAWTQASQLVKLAKCATGLEVLSGSADRGSGKLDALRALLEDRPLPTLVVAHFRDSVAACEAVALELGASVRRVDGGVARGARRESIRAFKAGGLDVLVATLDTISEGMTLVAADQIVFVERSWRPSTNEQALRRVHRIGQERPVTAIDLVTEGTTDERMLRVLGDKTDQQALALGKRELAELIAED